MNDAGQIKKFDNESEALKEGFKYLLTEVEAEKLSLLQAEDRLPELIYWEYHRHVLEGRKVDTMEKTKIKSVIKFVLSRKP